MTARRYADHPRVRATETLAPAEAAAVGSCAERAGGWLPLSRAWPELSPTTLRRVAQGARVTALVLAAVRARIRIATHRGEDR